MKILLCVSFYANEYIPRYCHLFVRAALLAAALLTDFFTMCWATISCSRLYYCFAVVVLFCAVVGL